MGPRIRLVTDSTGDVPPELAQRYGIVVVPAWVRFGMETYREGVDMDYDLFYRKIGEGDIPKSSQPSPGEFAEAYKPLLKEADTIISIHPTSKVSGVYQSATLAKGMFPGADIEVFDSTFVSWGAGFMVLAAARAIEKGLNKEKVLGILEKIRSALHIYATISNLEFLKASGRVSRLQDLLASLLDIKPVLAFRNGLVEAVDKVRTRSRALERVLGFTAKAMGDVPVRVALVHARVPEDVAWLEKRVRETLNCHELVVGEAGMALVANGGPDLIGIVAYPLLEEERSWA